MKLFVYRVFWRSLKLPLMMSYQLTVRDLTTRVYMPSGSSSPTMQRERTPQSQPPLSRKPLPVAPNRPAFHVDQSHVVAFTLGVLVTQLPRYVGLIAVCVAVYFLVGFDRKNPGTEEPGLVTVPSPSSRRPSATKATTPPVASKTVAKLDRISHERRVMENARQPSVDRNYAFRPYGS